MKKLVNNLYVPVVLLAIMLLPWNVNFAKSDCNGISSQTVCKNSLIITQKQFIQSPMQKIEPGVFPYDDLLIKI